ncbi:MAG: peptide chain release factor N(5)-glutamine methyltransferase [Burkholderiales bacterium]|nr:peptide chain release factor N(5)-glutamine methyltransferase [Phycisphaerae bacterium]
MAQADGPWTVERVLAWTRGFFERKQIDSPRLCAELIISHILSVPRIKLYTDYQRVLADPELLRMRELVKRAGEEEPIAYLTGRAHFFNLELDVTPDVLIPRPDTETLIEQILTLVRNVPGFEAPRVLDLCTGSGAIAIAIAQHIKTAQVVATDVSEKALAVAKINVDKHQLGDRITLLAGDLFAALMDYVDAAPFDVIIANPPYIPSAEVPKLARHVHQYEPHLALDGGADGLDLHRRILAGATDRLRDGGRVILEIAFDQSEPATEMIGQYPDFVEVKLVRDHAGNPRVLVAKLDRKRSL